MVAMNVEQILLTGISAVTSALLFVVKILWRRSEDCEVDRRDLRQEIEDVKTHNGELRGYLEAVGACNKKDCVFSRRAWPADDQDEADQRPPRPQ
jgi:hypothetical protein